MRVETYQDCLRLDPALRLRARLAEILSSSPPTVLREALAPIGDIKMWQIAETSTHRLVTDNISE